MWKYDWKGQPVYHESDWKDFVPEDSAFKKKKKNKGTKRESWWQDRQSQKKAKYDAPWRQQEQQEQQQDCASHVVRLLAQIELGNVCHALHALFLMPFDPELQVRPTLKAGLGLSSRRCQMSLLQLMGLLILAVPMKGLQLEEDLHHPQLLLLRTL